MRAYDIIYKKRNGGTLTEEEIRFFVRSFTSGGIPDYQASAFLMAAFLKGMDAKETVFLTKAMTDSGAKLDLSSLSGVKVDKHSTGGVGDGISLVLAPLAASCGVNVPMMSGRGLGHTGGTLDKLESIPGFRVGLKADEFFKEMQSVGCSLIGQTEDVAPADRKFYALRDVTATVESIPLITASILSKKLAEGADALVFDVKTGSGAFMREPKDAAALAKSLVSVTKRAGKKAVALVTDMEEPLGYAVGNSLEVLQAVQILKGQEDPRARTTIELTEILGGWMVFLGKAAKNPEDGRKKIREARLNGSGLDKFREIVRFQGGDPKVCDAPEAVLPRAKFVKAVASLWKGSVSSMDARSIGIASLMLGAGREQQDSVIDLSAGIVLHKKIGDRVERGESLAELHCSDEKKMDAAEKLFLSAVKIGKTRPKARLLVRQVIR